MEFCDDGTLEADFYKVAVYALGRKPTHAARQLDSGNWTSKLGRSVDIEHQLEGLEGEEYGKVVQYLRCPRNHGTI